MESGFENTIYFQIQTYSESNLVEQRKEGERKRIGEKKEQTTGHDMYSLCTLPLLFTKTPQAKI